MLIAGKAKGDWQRFQGENETATIPAFAEFFLPAVGLIVCFAMQKPYTALACQMAA